MILKSIIKDPCGKEVIMCTEVDQNADILVLQYWNELDDKCKWTLYKKLGEPVDIVLYDSSVWYVHTENVVVAADNQVVSLIPSVVFARAMYEGESNAKYCARCMKPFEEAISKSIVILTNARGAAMLSLYEHFCIDDSLGKYMSCYGAYICGYIKDTVSATKHPVIVVPYGLFEDRYYNEEGEIER